jgi:hypothetical protein
MANFKELLEAKIKEIKRQARSTPDRRPIQWFHRGEVMELLVSAFKARADQVILDGRLFDIIYKPNGAHAVVRPNDGRFVPCGYFIIDKFIADWETHEQATRVTRLSDQAST